MLFPKPNKDCQLPQSYRPITLLNGNYKFLMKILATRTLTCFDAMVYPTQRGFTKNRQVVKDIRTAIVATIKAQYSESDLMIQKQTFPT